MSAPSKKCPVCGKPPHNRFAPFCSGRCADLDLGKWLKGSYVVPGAPNEDEANDSTPPQPPEEE